MSTAVPQVLCFSCVRHCGKLSIRCLVMSPSHGKNTVNYGNRNPISVKHIYAFSNFNGKCF